MFLSALVVVVTTSFVLVQCHRCKDYDLSASEQFFLMKHYLRTSRKDDGLSTGKPIATGQVGGNDNRNKAGGVNYLCLPNDPENGESQKDDNVQLFGTEYLIGSSFKLSGMKADMIKKKKICALHDSSKPVFEQSDEETYIYDNNELIANTIVLFTGRKTCYKG
ncbi:unnamed protein product [Mytilus edulis]|uniref:Uncharacterized protein n=1 Tax=Mytilus edulis TaxID=6550 RepID=A0A8S3SV03_MYTED|nr:unnamed protein product [Mytilus edulis]